MGILITHSLTKMDINFLHKNIFYPNSYSEKYDCKKKDRFLLMPSNQIRLVKNKSLWYYLSFKTHKHHIKSLVSKSKTFKNIFTFLAHQNLVYSLQNVDILLNTSYLEK